MAGNERGTSHVSHSSQERTACDKCRCQKLRCVRDEPTDIDSLSACRRCVKAGLVSFTSPTKPLGRHSTRRTRLSSNPPPATSNRSGVMIDIHLQERPDIRVPHARPLSVLPSESDNGSRTNPSSSMINLKETKLGEPGIPGNKDDKSLVNPVSDTIDVQSCRLNLSLSQQVMALETAAESDRDFRAKILQMNVALVGSEQRPQTAQISSIDLVLDSISQFLRILQQCSQDSLKLGSPHAEPRDKLHQTSQERTEVYGPSQHAEPWIFHAFMPEASQAISESPTASAFDKRQTAQPLSTSTILNLASCYFHVIAIYDILFQQMHLALRDMSSPSRETIQIIQGLELKGFLLQKTGLQVKILIQVMKHQLELVEKGLGLPDQYRVRPRASQQPQHADGQRLADGKGIFDSFEAKALLDSAMKLNGRAASRSTLSLRHNLDVVLELTKTLQ